MILILISVIIIIPTLIGLGKITENIAGTLYNGVSGKLFSGIMGISVLWTVLAFFTPLSIYIEVVTILAGLTYFVKAGLYKDLYHLLQKNRLIILCTSLLTLFCGSFYPFILDHFGYYVPSIQWLREYGLVKGISNLDLILGQMSVWHIFQAGFSHLVDPSLRINTVLLIIYIFYITEKRQWIHLCFLPAMLLFSQSPSPDLPVFIFSLFILSEILSGNTRSSLLFTFSIFVFIIKPTMIWLPLVSFLYSALIIRSAPGNFLPGIALLLLFFFKNIWTFGYPVFPVTIGDMGISWKPNAEILQTSSEYAIRKTYDMQYTYEQIRHFSQWDYIKNWLLLKGIKSKINILLMISLLVFIIYSIIKKNRIITIICISLVIKSILVILFSAQYRFFTDVFFVIFFVLFFEAFSKRISIALFSVLSFVLISTLTFPGLLQQYVPSFKLGKFMGKFEATQFYKPSSYKYNTYQTFRVGELQFKVSKKYPYNFDTPLPAISSGYIFDYDKAGIFPQPIDKNDLGKGFIWKRLNDHEKAELKKVIHSINVSYQ
ncbi:LIC_10190 family membrane protein [Chryseobacterium sp. CT-SW4]|uniref:LIC_10190 family membrane protein n=1 Tax=Chryseobacterium sp. SW-1 TaxID=3157343 RepID=UPI003B0168DB